jgi:hypothetical protein
VCLQALRRLTLIASPQSANVALGAIAICSGRCNASVIITGLSSSQPNFPPSFFFGCPAVYSVDHSRVIRLRHPNDGCNNRHHSEPNQGFHVRSLDLMNVCAGRWPWTLMKSVAEANWAGHLSESRPRASRLEGALHLRSRFFNAGYIRRHHVDGGHDFPRRGLMHHVASFRHTP